MPHYVLKSFDGSPLFMSWTEGLALWRFLVVRVPGMVACFVMPDHVHVMVDRDVAAELAVAMRSYARWRNARRGTRGPVWGPMSQTPIGTGDKRARLGRYIHLNGCRGGLARDPLAWPLSTYRDAVGLALRPVRPRVADPVAYHRYTSGDPSVSVAGTELPAWQVLFQGHAGLAQVGDAVSSGLRVPVTELRRRGPARTLFVRSARILTRASVDDIAEHAAVSRRNVFRATRVEDEDVRLVARIVGDPRFFGLGDHDLRREPSWRAWVGRRR